MTIHPGNLSGRPPLGLKGTRRHRQGKIDAAYLRDVRRLPCVICEAWGFRQASPTEAHHTICGRYGQDKTPDREAIPLCDGHHQAKFDRGRIAIHEDKALWQDHYGSDRDYIAITQAAVDRLRKRTAS